MIELDYTQKEEIGLNYVLNLLEPACPYGARRLKTEGFYNGSSDALERELDNVALMGAALETARDAAEAVRGALSGLKDVSGTLKTCALGPLGEIELFELTAFVLRLKALIPLAEALPGYEKLTGARFVPVDGVLAILDPAGGGRLSFYVEDARSPELLRFRQEKREIEQRLRNPASETDRETLLALRLEKAKGEEAALRAIYAAMTEELRPWLPALEQNALAAGRLDAALSKAALALRFGARRPETGGETLSLENARNPRIAEALEARGRVFAPITAEMPRGVTVLTGANMGGKSVALQTVTLNVVLALMGYFVFCDRAAVPLFDRIELINRDFSDAAGGLSSFGGEILRFNAAAERLRSGGRSFIVMDEFARGTNAKEGAAIACGVVKYLSDKNAVTLLATHYDGAAAEAARHYQVRGLRPIEEGARTVSAATGAEALRRIEDAMDYGLIPVERETECPRDALRICRLLGMDPALLTAVEEVENQQNFQNVLDKS